MAIEQQTRNPWNRRFVRSNRALAGEFLCLIAVAVLMGFTATPYAEAQTSGKPPSQAAKPELPKEKQTTLGLLEQAAASDAAPRSATESKPFLIVARTLPPRGDRSHTTIRVASWRRPSRPTWV